MSGLKDMTDMAKFLGNVMKPGAYAHMLHYAQNFALWPKALDS